MQNKSEDPATIALKFLAQRKSRLHELEIEETAAKSDSQKKAAAEKHKESIIFATARFLEKRLRDKKQEITIGYISQ